MPAENLPPALAEALATALGPIRSAYAVSGGDINAAARVETATGRYFVKWSARPQLRLFQAEARGLTLLAQAHALRVPAVIAHLEQPAALVLEWIESGRRTPPAMRALGHGLAQLHRCTAPAFGLDHDNYIGATVQRNTPQTSWLEFFRDARLGAQRQIAQTRGTLTPDRARWLDRIVERLDRWLDPASATPSLLHGDLWGGNYLIDDQQQPVLIDPAVYYGDREAELAFTALFGGFGPDFYAAYHEAWPLPADYAERRDLYNLYHLLNHLNLFGESYGGAVDAVLQRYGR